MEEETVTIEAEEDGNFVSPVLQRLFEVWDEYDNGEIEEDEVLAVLGRVEALTRTQIQEMEASGKEPGVDLHDPNRVAILMSFQAHLDGVEKMRQFFSTDNPDLVDEAFDILQQATNQMMNGLHGLLETNRETAPKLCVQCSSPNPRDATVCSSCNAILPVAEAPRESRLVSMESPDMGEADAIETTPNYIELSEAHEAWIDEERSAQELFDTAAAVKERLVAEHQELVAFMESGESGEEMVDYLNARLQALELSADSVEQILVALESDNPPGVEDGMFEFAQATVSLLDADKLAPPPPSEGEAEDEASQNSD